MDITPPAAVTGTSYRGSTITFSDVRSSIIARNVAHGLCVGQTRIRTSFVPPVQAHVVRDWIAKHPRIVIPVIVFFLGTLTYTVRGIPFFNNLNSDVGQIFDPVRVLMVEGKILEWFNYRGYCNFLNTLASDLIFYTEFRLYQWLHSNTVDRLTFRSTDSTDTDTAWQERQDADITLRNYLNDTPSMSDEILCRPPDSCRLQTVSPLYM